METRTGHRVHEQLPGFSDSNLIWTHFPPEPQASAWDTGTDLERSEMPSGQIGGRTPQAPPPSPISEPRSPRLRPHLGQPLHQKVNFPDELCPPMTLASGVPTSDKKLLGVCLHCDSRLEWNPRPRLAPWSPGSSLDRPPPPGNLFPRPRQGVCCPLWDCALERT